MTTSISPTDTPAHLDPREVAYLDSEYSAYYNKRLLAVRPMAKEELEAFGWDVTRGDSPMVLIFEDHMAMIPSCDPEGNGPGFLFTESLA
jgi:hypothetical protein